MKLSDIRCSPQALGRRGLGLVLILSTALIWVVASFISELLVSTKPGQRSFHVPPLLLTYLATAVFMMFLPIAFARMWWQGRTAGNSRSAVKYQRLESAIRAASDPDDDAAAIRQEQQQQQQQQEGRAGSSLGADLEEAMALAQQQASVSDRQAAHREALAAAAQCFLLWFAAQYCFNLSLSWTSVTSNTILSSTSSLFTFALSMLFLKEPYSLAKLLSIGLCIGGTVLVTISDKDASSSSSSSSSPAGNTSILGDLLCLVSALFYASYVVVMRRALPDDEEANVALFFGYVGLFSTLALGPVVGMFAWSGAWDLGAMSRETYAIIAVEGVLNYAFSDYLWAHAVLLLGPTIATLGLSVQIPIAAVAEAVWGHPQWLSSGATVGMTVAGTLLIMAGFFWGNLAGKGPVPGSHHRNEGAAGDRRYLQVGADEWNAAFGSDDDDTAPLAIPVSTSASIQGHPRNNRAAQPSTAAAGDGRQSASIELSPTGGSGKGGAAGGPASPENGTGDAAGGGSRSSSEGSPGSGGSRRPYRASRLARTTSYLDPMK